MRPELETVLDSLAQMPTSELPALLGELEVIRATALLRMSVPAPPKATDELVDIKKAALRLGVSADYLYRHKDRLPFARRMGRKLVFSSQGIDEYIKKRTQ